MILRFRQDAGKRFKKGDVRDYPSLTWKQIAKSAGVPLEKLTEPVPGLVDMRQPRAH